MTPELSSKARELRDALYEVPSSDKNWEACKEFWCRPDSFQWLSNEWCKEQVKRMARGVNQQRKDA